MAKNKQQKQKERERRVARKKLAETEARRTREKAAEETPPPGFVPERVSLLKKAVPQVKFVPTHQRSPAKQRRAQ